ncbi:hypothetical protein BJ165DRAFT_363321 [Panaeolus papilionaceus]|nr:hypothetical protein BJ165DRAFT_363321 [Panaeolus papilionaceus]
MTRLDEIQEIVDLIIDHLVSDIQSTASLAGTGYRLEYPISIKLHELKQCSLISKAFASRSQKYLFSTIMIYADAVPIVNTLPETERTSPHLEPALDKPSSRAVNNLLNIFEQKPHLVKHLHTMTICDQFAYLVRRYESLRKLFDLLRSQGNPSSVEIRLRQ